MDEGRLQGRPHALCRQQSGQGAGGLRRGNLPPAADPANHPTAVAGVGAMAEGDAIVAGVLSVRRPAS